MRCMECLIEAVLYKLNFQSIICGKNDLCGNFVLDNLHILRKFHFKSL